ncbi:zf-HC2 domain-containing protein [candidate division KSB1 bacterium]|nr:zf-HC2 domain-containing protein [candidate division KSB1 bacterium]
MNNCHQCEELISDYIEGKLDSNSRQQFDNHIKACSQCAGKTKNVKVLHNTLIALPGKQVSSDFDSMLRARIGIENKRERRKRESLLFSWKVRVPIYGISVVLVLFILVTVFSLLSNKNTFPPNASMNPEYAAVNQNVFRGSYTFYSLDRKPANDVFSQQQSRYLKKRERIESTSSDSSSLAVYNEPTRSSSVDFYQTSF